MRQPMPGVARAVTWLLGAGLALAALLLLMPAYAASPEVRLAAFLMLAWWLPGLGLALLWRLPQADWIEIGLAALGLGLGWLITGALILHAIPGPFTLPQLLALYGGGGLALLAALLRWPPTPPHAVSGKTVRWGLALLTLACVLRLPGLGYHEFHADEVVLLRQATRSIEGEDDAFAEHTKGPGEIALATVAYRAVGVMDEGMARLPFALMSAGSVLAVAWLGRALWNGSAGLWAGALLSANGFALGLSRIAQYQAAMLLLSALAVLAAWNFARQGAPRWLALAAAFSAIALTMHYEFVLLAPALIFLWWLGWRQMPNPRTLWRTLIPVGSGAALLVAVAYVPALLNPYFANTTQGYLSGRMGTVGTFNLPFFVEMSTFYNSTYFFAGLAALVLVGTALPFAAPRTLARAGLHPAHVRLTTGLLTLWWLPAFLLYIFVVDTPGTHFYLLMDSWSLLAALPLALLTTLRRPAWRAAALALVGVWLAVSIVYLYLLFFRQQPEYLVNHEREAVPFYWAPFPVPEKPRFGFPIHEGWKTLGVLGEWGYLNGTYASNDDAWSLRRWYLTPFRKRDFAEQPDYIFVARHLQERNPAFDDDILDSYHRTGEVQVRGEPRLEIWAKTPLPVPYVTFDAAHFDPLFRAVVTRLDPAGDPPGRPAEMIQTGVQHEPLGDALVLESAYLSTAQAAPGATVHLALVWEPQAPLPLDYKLFVHVAGDDGRPVAQWDGLPGLNTARTSQWPVGRPFQDHVLLALPPETAPGDYSLLVGLYDPATGNRLGDRAISVTRLEVR